MQLRKGIVKSSLLIPANLDGGSDFNLRLLDLSPADWTRVSFYVNITDQFGGHCPLDSLCKKFPRGPVRVLYIGFAQCFNHNANPIRNKVTTR